MVAAAASIAAPIWGQEPPETAGDDAGAEGAGACVGACTPPLEFEPAPEDPELLELDPLLVDCVAVPAEL